MKFENKKWLVRVALAGALCLGVASIAKADSRLDGMGANVQEVDDVDAIWLYPNQLLQYKNTVDFRLNPIGLSLTSLITTEPTTTNGLGINEWGGVIHDLGDDFGTIATYVNRPSALGNDQGTLLTGAFKPLFGNYSTAVGGFNNKYTPSSNVDVFWAKSGFGLHLTYGDNEVNANGGGPAPIVSSQVWGLSAGFDLGSFMSFNTSEFHIDYTEDYLTLNRVAGPESDNGVYTFKLGWLGQSTLNSNDNVRLFADLQYDNTSLPTGWSGSDLQQTSNDLEVLVGSSIKHNISEKGFVNTGLEFEYDALNSSTNTAADSWNLVWNGSVESALNSWLTLRAGLDKVIVNRTYTQGGPVAPTGTDTSLVGGLNNNVAFSTGLSANVENWTLDTQVSVSSLDTAIGTVAPGSGIFYGGNGQVFSVTQADLRYKF